MASTMELDSTGDVVEDSPLDQTTQNNYRAWKKNTPFLYDYISTYTLLWPSMTVQFFPDLERPSDHLAVESGPESVVYQRLLLGTFTSAQAVDKISILQLPYYENLNQHLTVDKLNYNSEKSEFELSTVSKRKVSTLQNINHFGDVNKLLYMPQNPDVIASGNNYGDVVVYDRTKHSTYKNNDHTEIDQPELKLGRGSAVDASEGQEIFALDWNKQQEGSIISGKMNGNIDLYDIRAQMDQMDPMDSKLSSLPPLQSFQGSAGINDITWTPDHRFIFSTTDENGYFKVYDTRIEAGSNVIISEKVSDSPINAVSVNPVNSMFSALGDSAGNVSVWDIRSVKSQGPSVFELKGVHSDAVTRVKWHPKFHNVLGSCSTDKSVRLYDLEKCYKKEDPVVFLHGGHMLGVNDFDWSLHEDWMVSSVADDNTLHIWKPANIRS